MALQIRRGTNAERLAITPAEGELIYTTDSKRVFVGDGTTAGGVSSAGMTALLEDSSPQLGGGLDLNGNDITGTGNINITGNITASGTINATGNIGLGDNVGGDTLTIGASITGDLIPTNDTANDIGSSTKYWREIYTEQLTVSSQLTAQRLMGTLIAEDSTIVFDAQSGQLTASSLVGTFTGDVVGNVTGNLTGIVTGDMIGSVFADDSGVMIDGVAGTIVGDVVNTDVDTQKLTVTRDSTSNRDALLIKGLTAGSPGLNADYIVSRGSVASPTVVQAGDTIVNMVGQGYDGDSYETAAIIKLGVDKYTTSIADGIIPGRILFLTFDESGNTGADNAMCFNRLGNLGIKKDDPTEALDVVGNAIITGTLTAGGLQGTLSSDDSTIIVDGSTGAITAPSFVQFGSFTTTQRDALSAANGMVIYNTTDNKFQGYENGAWTNLI